MTARLFQARARASAGGLRDGALFPGTPTGQRATSAARRGIRSPLNTTGFRDGRVFGAAPTRSRTAGGGGGGDVSRGGGARRSRVAAARPAATATRRDIQRDVRRGLVRTRTPVGRVRPTTSRPVGTRTTTAAARRTR